MDNNNWRSNQGGEPTMETSDWRTQLQPDSRQRIINKIMDTLMKHLPFSGQEGLPELKEIAAKFEEKIYAGATSQSHYLRKISLKMYSLETKSQNTMVSSLSSSTGGTSIRPPDPVSVGLQSQVHSQAQSLPMQMVANQSQNRQQLLSQNMQNSAGVQSSTSLSSVLTPVSNLSHNSVPCVVSQNSNIQNMSTTAQNAVGNTMGQGVPSNMLARQIQGRQQVLPQQQQQQQQSQSQSQNQSQYLYQQQLHNPLLKSKFPQSNVSQSTMIPQQQQQNLLQPTQLQSSQQAVMQTSSAMQPSMMQPSLPSLQPNQQSTKSMLQQHQQSLLRQPQQASVVHQQQRSMAQQTMLPPQQQQQLMGQQPNATNIQQNHLIGQQNNVGDMQQLQRLQGQQNNLSNLQQQQQLLAQQNNLSNMHQQQLGPQSSITGLQQQQQQLIGSQTGNSSMQTNQHSMHMLQQSKAPGQQPQQSSSTLLPNQGQQSQPQQSQQQLLSQIQSQPPQMQQQPNPLQRDMPQRLKPSGQAPGSLLQQQNVIDQQKQLYQSQRAPPETSSTLDSTAQTGHANGGDWKEEVYQKIKSLKDMYFADLNDFYQKIVVKLQQHDSLQQPKTQQLEKLNFFKTFLDQSMAFLQLNKSNIEIGHKEKLPAVGKQIVGFLNSNRARKPVSSLQQGQPPPNMQSVQQPQSQINPVQSHENPVNPQTMQQNNISSLHQNSVSSLSRVPSTQQNMLNSLKSNSNMDSGQGSSLSSMQQVGVGSMQQTHVSAPQQANAHLLSSQNGVNVLQPNMSSLQSNSGILQQQQLKQQQEQQMLQSQQLNQQFQQRQMQHQLLQQKQQLHQHQHQQQLQQQSKQLLSGQLQAYQQQMSQLHQVNDDLKIRQSLGVKSGLFQQHVSAGQHPYSHQSLKSGSPFPIPSNQLLQAASPQILQHSSPQVDQQNLLTSLTKPGTPLQSANSPFVVPSPSTPLAPSPMLDPEKPMSGVPSLPNAGNIGQQQTTNVGATTSSIAIGTPGISASPLLADCSGPDGTHGNNLASVSGKSTITEQPLERLIKAVKSMSQKALHASISDIGSVVCMTDRIAGSAPGNGSRAAAGEDLVALTMCRLQARNFITQDATNGTRKMRRYTSDMPISVMSSAGSINDSLTQLNGSEASDLESTATSGVKRRRVEANHALLEEIKEINQQLIDTVVDISNEDVDLSAAADGGEGTIVKCSFSAVALSPTLKSQYASAQMSPIQPLMLLVPTNYPNCSPVLLDKLPVEVREYEDLSVKAKSMFSKFLRRVSQPMSLGEIARTWDVCARAAIVQHSQQSGGGSFSSKYGTWVNCLSAA